MIPALPLLVHLFHIASGGTDLSTDYSRVRVLRTTSELELDLETTSMEMLIDGEPAEGRGPGGGGSSLVRRAVLVEHVLEGGADGPRHVRRTFESLHDESTFSFGEDERTNESDYPLAGVTLEMTRDDQGEVKIELSEGAEPDDGALLEGHDPALALDSLLPEGAVEVDATWKLDHDQILRALATALDQRLFPQAPPGDFGRERGGERGQRERRGPGGRGPGGGRNLGLLEWEGKGHTVRARGRPRR